MNRDEIHALLLRIVNDSVFRHQLETDPVAALAAVGITFDPADVPPGGVQLPTNEEIMEALEELTDQVLAAKSHISVLLCLSC